MKFNPKILHLKCTHKFLTSNLTTQPRENQKTSNLTTREPLTSNLTTREPLTSDLTTREPLTSNLLCHDKIRPLGPIPANRKKRVFQHISFNIKTTEMAYLQGFSYIRQLTLDINTTHST